MKRAAFLDRDGVLNEPLVREGRAYAPLAVNDFRLVADATTHVARLRGAGLVTIVVTNQPEIARGRLASGTLEEMHRRLRDTLPLDDLYVCAHDPDEGCACHKPRPGMLLAAADKWGLELGRSFLIGDRWRDIEAGRSVGCYTILIERPYSACATADARVGGLPEAVDLVLARLRES
ncbi:MAG: D-glycero-alpha-D-manno-heptose-1,7-bisphosphate 7-phosphatase [Candidatus Rokuibacteriota bacterium]